MKEDVDLSVELEESFALQATMALDDAGVKSKWKKGKLYVAKRDIKKAEKALAKSFKHMKKGAEPDLWHEEIEIEVDEDVGDRIAARNKAYALKKKRDHEYEMKYGRKKDKKGIGEKVEEGSELDEKRSSTGYDLYHKDFSSAMQHAYAHAKKKGFTVDPVEIDN